MSNSILPGFQPRAEWAQEKGISDRTAARYEKEGLPTLDFGGRKYVHIEGSQEWIVGRVKQANPKRRRT